MKNAMSLSMFAVLAAAIAVVSASTTVAGQDRQNPESLRRLVLKEIPRTPDGKLPYQPWALAEREVNRRSENSYLDNEGRCILSGLPRIMLFTFEIAYVPGQILLFYDQAQERAKTQ